MPNRRRIVVLLISLMLLLPQDLEDQEQEARAWVARGLRSGASSLSQSVKKPLAGRRQCDGIVGSVGKREGVKGGPAGR